MFLNFVLQGIFSSNTIFLSACQDLKPPTQWTEKKCTLSQYAYASSSGQKVRAPCCIRLILCSGHPGFRLPTDWWSRSCFGVYESVSKSFRTESI